MPKPSLHIPWFLRFERSRSVKSPQADSGSGSSSSSPSSQFDTSQQAHGGPIAASQNISDSVQTPGPHTSAANADSDPSQHQGLPAAPDQSPASPLQPSLFSHASTYSSRPGDGNSGLLTVVQNVSEARNVSVPGDGNLVNYYNVNNSNQFMEKLLEKTILGAAFDSSARDPPPRCHPGTRLAILARCLEFITNVINEKKMRWVVGAAGVGKSAIMQNVAESPLLSVSARASIFFSINGRNDGTKAIMTLAYQLAARCEPYRVLIEYEITRDPCILQSSVSVQFKKFVIEPFIHHPQLKAIGRILVIIDGLDECDKSLTQRELLQLISDLCSTYPSSPIVWMIASRPEPHITSFFAQDHIQAVSEKEEILVNSEEGRNDVERFLRNELTNIQNEFSLSPRSQWPSEQDLWKLANASGGLFVYADTVIKYVGDPVSGNPTSQLNDVLKFIDAHPLPKLPQEQHPMARLDALYAQILSKVPERTMVDTRKILLALISDSRRRRSARKGSFLVFCNWLGMTCDDAYAAIRHLHSLLYAPGHDEAHKAGIRSFHKSFLDYISDFSRSGFSSDIKHESRRLEAECTFRILEEAPDGIDVDEMVNHIICTIQDSRSFDVGVLARAPGARGDISLTWLVDGETDWNDNRTRLELYKFAVSNVVRGIRKGELIFRNEACVRLVTTRWHFYDSDGFPFHALQSLAFGGPRRNEFLNNGLLKQIPVKTLDFIHIVWKTRLQFRCPITTTTNLSDHWDTRCVHNRAGVWGEGKEESWTAEFGARSTMFECDPCCQRLEQQLESWKMRSPDYPVTVLFTSTETCFIEFQFIDPDDQVSEWTYWLAYFITEKERRILGSPV
ncbi:hypothetical protein Agabi119p4_9567 [Agaricus bisporus var. burnettii]|uniref:NACHT domain-containing protein n=1 Tax=Agaricus bisporus var. burnettii TaxID=192524 RepID=A0A8H7EXG7_AGABI|nr:hypothetical protein Agabi119p4_9567 [Agaricus bisporus var. burnettii]